MFSQFNIELLFRIASKYRLREFSVKRRRERERKREKESYFDIDITLHYIRVCAERQKERKSNCSQKLSDRVVP